MSIEIGAPVDAICPRCSADALVIAAVAGGEVTKIRCQECGVTYPDDAETGDASKDAAAGADAFSDDVPQKRPRRRATLQDLEVQPQRRRTETLIDFDVSLTKPTDE